MQENIDIQQANICNLSLFIIPLLDESELKWSYASFTLSTVLQNANHPSIHPSVKVMVQDDMLVPFLIAKPMFLSDWVFQCCNVVDPWMDTDYVINLMD